MANAIDHMNAHAGKNGFAASVSTGRRIKANQRVRAGSDGAAVRLIAQVL
jgi:hypothetical protein